MIENKTSKEKGLTRRERQKQETREAILSAALNIARTEGWAAVTVRHVADLIEYRSPIIYEYFANKDALLEELQAQGFTLLSARVEGSSAGEDGRARILKMSDAYVDFAYEQPELYQLMHGWNSANVSLERTLAGATQVGRVVQDGIEKWAAEQDVLVSDPSAKVETAWGLLHGLISVEMLGRIGGGQERVRQLARQALEDLLTAWAAR